MVARAIALVAAVAVIAAAGCYSPRFTYSDPASHGGAYACRILSPYGTVDYDKGVIALHPGGKVVARQFRRGKYEAEMIVRLVSGTGVRVRFHTVDKDTGVTPGIVFTARTGASSLQIPGQATIAAHALTKDVPLKIRTISESKYFFLEAGCDTLYNGACPGPSTDAISVESIDSSEVQVYGMGGEEVN